MRQLKPLPGCSQGSGSSLHIETLGGGGEVVALHMDGGAEGGGAVPWRALGLPPPAAPGLPLALGGFSFGGYVAAQAAARLAEDPLQGAPVERLVLVGPATSRFNMPATVAPDTVVIHGEADDVVPLAATLDWARPQVLPVIVLPGVGHFFHGQLTRLKDQVIQAWHA